MMLATLIRSVGLTDWIVTPFPFPDDAIAQPASRNVGEFRTEDQTPSRVPDAGSDDLVLVSWMGVGFEAREEPSPHPTASAAQIALSCGFADFGHFSRRYKEA
jgi:hypothetical protein